MPDNLAGIDFVTDAGGNNRNTSLNTTNTPSVNRTKVHKQGSKPTLNCTKVQSFVNIAVATGIFPNTGITLPFVSYGLTSLVSFCIGIGFVLNVGLQTRKY